MLYICFVSEIQKYKRKINAPLFFLVFMVSQVGFIESLDMKQEE